MNLDDFLDQKAKKKKKSKTKQNPADLMEELAKNPEISKIVREDALPAQPKHKPEEDEWEALEDEDADIEIEISAMADLGQTQVDESAKNKGSVEDETDGLEKKVWGLKVPDEPVVEEPTPVEPEPEPATKGGLYIPAHLRRAAPTWDNGPKPNTSSEAEFPTLDAVVEPAPTSRKIGQPQAEESPSEKWLTVGSEPRPASSSVYVPPSRRPGGAPGAVLFGQSRPSTFDSDSFRSNTRGQGFERSDTRGQGFERSDNRGQGFERSDTRGQGFERSSQPLTASSGPWVRGQTLDTSSNAPSSFGERGQQPRVNNHRWSNGKVLHDTSEKTDFKITQSNRFSALNES